MYDRRDAAPWPAIAIQHPIHRLRLWNRGGRRSSSGPRPLGETPSNPVGPVGAEQGLTVIGIWLVVFTLGSVVCMIARVDISE